MSWSGGSRFSSWRSRKLTFHDGSFDVAVMALVISFLADPEKAIAEMTRVVRHGGWVALICGMSPGAEYHVIPFT
jgi:ubiquinone/menaquinone biosynthesis C-methylase UbiE